MRKKVTDEEFNRMVTAILIKFSMFMEIPTDQIEKTLQNFSKQLLKQHEEFIQLSQTDQTEQESVRP